MNKNEIKLLKKIHSNILEDIFFDLNWEDDIELYEEQEQMLNVLNKAIVLLEGRQNEILSNGNG